MQIFIFRAPATFSKDVNAFGVDDYKIQNVQFLPLWPIVLFFRLKTYTDMHFLDHLFF